MATTRREFLTMVGGAAAAGAVVPRRRWRGRRPRRACRRTRSRSAWSPSAPASRRRSGTAGLRGTEWWAERVNKAGGILGRQVAARRRGGIHAQGHRRALPQAHPPGQGRGRARRHLHRRDAGARRRWPRRWTTPWLSWDGTTQKGVDETMPNPKWAFSSVDNEVEAIVAGQLTPKYFKGIKTVAGIGNDYSYGHDCWETYQAVLKRYIPDVKFVLELFPKLGVTDFTSHIAAIQQSKADLLMCSFWSGDATIIMKQAAAVGPLQDHEGRVHHRGRRPRLAQEGVHARGAAARLQLDVLRRPQGQRRSSSSSSASTRPSTTSTRPTSATTPTSAPSPTRPRSRRPTPPRASGRPRRRWSRRSRASRWSRSPASEAGARTTSRCATSTRASPPTRTATTS